MTETKNEAFRRLGWARVERLKEPMRKIANLSSPNYEFDEEEVKIMFDAIQKMVDECRAKFSKVLAKKGAAE